MSRLQAGSTPRPSSTLRPIAPEPTDRVEPTAKASSKRVDPPAWRPREIFGLAVLAGWIAGFLELAAALGPTSWALRVSMTTLARSRHAFWMIPLADLLMLTTLGAVLALVVRIRPHASTGHIAVVLIVLTALGGPLLAIEGLHGAAAVILILGLARVLSGALVDLRPMYRRVLGVVAIGLTFVGSLAIVWQYDRTNGVEARAVASRPPIDETAESRPNVLLIVLDTVRADHLGCYGYPRPTTPFLDRLAARGVRFEHARAPSPWTLPSHATLFTGRWPHELSVRVDRALDQTNPTLAEELSERGYRTGAFIANTFYCNAWYGLDRGFDRYVDDPANTEISTRTLVGSTSLGAEILKGFAALGMADAIIARPRKDAARINAEFLGWLDRTEPDRPVFATLNYFDAHDPYILPIGVEPMFGDDRDVPTFATLAEQLRGVDRDHLDESDLDVIARSAQPLVDGYDNCLTYLDAKLEALFKALSQRGLMESTWVIVTSDHGEHFGEHGLFGHGNSLYRPLVHVPLLIVPPGDPFEPEGQGGSRLARVVDEPVSLRDIPATILMWADGTIGTSNKQGATPNDLPGRSLSRFWMGSEAIATFDVDAWQHPVFSEADLGNGLPTRQHHAPISRGPMSALAAGGRSYIRNGDGVEQLFDLDDPDERDDLVNDPEEESALMRFRANLDGIKALPEPGRDR